MTRKPRTWSDLQTLAIHKPDQIEYNGQMRPLDLAWLSGRGDGKTTGAEGVMWRWVRDYPGIFVMFVKHERKSLAAAFKSATEYFASCDQNMTYTKEPMFIRFSNGSSILFEGLQDRISYEKSLQGMSAGAMIVDELGAFPDLDLVFYAISNIRGKEWPRSVWFLSNPGGRSHGATFDLFVDGHRSGDIFETSAGRVTMYLSGTYRDNPFLDDDYINALKSATRNDPTKRDMWLNSSWHLLGGSLFGNAYSNENNVRWWPEPKFYGQEDWKFTLGYDDGQKSPSWCGIFAEAKSTGARGPDLQLYRRGSKVLVAEYTTAQASDRTLGDYSTAKEVARGIKETCEEWYKARRFGYGDPMIFGADGHEQTIGHIFIDNGVTIERASSRKRVPGWQVLRTYLANAMPEGQRHDGDPALYVNEAACPQFVWEIKNAMPKDSTPDDTDSTDHALDGTRYNLVSTLSHGGGITRTELRR